MSKMLKTLEEKIEIQQKKLEQMLARKQQIEARQKSIERRKARQDDTRRKILAGAFFLELAGEYPLQAEFNGQTLDSFLKRDDDRALFGLMPVIR